MLVSVLMHGAVIVLAMALTYAKAHMPREPEPVRVEFRPPPPPPPPPPPAGHKPRTLKPKTPVVPKVPPRVLVQPVEVPRVEEKPPEPPAEEEEEEGVEGGVEGGVVGGVIGGVVGGQIGGQLGEPEKGPVEFTDAMTPPKIISGPEPQYTDQAIEHEVEGLMVVKCVVSLTGQVHGCRVLKSLPFMDRAMIETLQSRRYSPAMFQGKAIEVDYTFKIRLALPR
jgi:protein TonB